MTFRDRCLLLAATFIAQLAHAQGTEPCFEPNLGRDLGLSDDSVSQGNALGFTFPFAGRNVTSVDISSNGFIWLASSSDNGCCNGSVGDFLARAPRLAAVWNDLDPSSGGSVHFATFPGRAVITWNQVPEYGASNLITSQVQILADGTIQMFWQSPLRITGHTALVGVTPGTGATNPGAINFSSALPFDSGTVATVYQVFGPNTFDLGGMVIRFTPNTRGGFNVTRRTDCRFGSFQRIGIGCPAALPVTLGDSITSRPIIGASFDLIVGDAPANPIAGFIWFGDAVGGSGTSLGHLGMTGCTLYVTPLILGPFTVQGRYSVVTVPIPNDPSLVGGVVHAQTAIVDTAVNPAGVVTSNGGRIEIGQ